LKEVPLSEIEAKALLHDAFLASKFPLRFFPEVSHEYFHPQYDEFAPGNAWSLYNAFTMAAKGIKSVRTNQLTLSGVTGAFRKGTHYKTLTEQVADGDSI
jgi:hypothetical protein